MYRHEPSVEPSLRGKYKKYKSLTLHEEIGSSQLFIYIMSCLHLLWDWFKRLSIVLHRLLSHLLCLENRSINSGTYPNWFGLHNLHSQLYRVLKHCRNACRHVLLHLVNEYYRAWCFFLRTKKGIIYHKKYLSHLCGRNLTFQSGGGTALLSDLPLPTELFAKRIVYYWSSSITNHAQHGDSSFTPHYC
jgi:hypothetical protein